MANSSKGVHTSEFWLSLCAVLIGGLMSANIFESETILKILGGCSSLLAVLGYQTSRAWVKSSESKASAIKAAVEKKL